MGDALTLACEARFRSSPNPWVGAVVVAGGERYRGATGRPGERHAEVVALAQAGEAARGATMYVTLEPCAHHGRTGPCTDAIVRAGVSRVVIGMVDPDPAVNGRGVEALRSSGLDVVVGVRGREVERQLAPYLKHRRTGRPWVVLKLAATLDGRIAAPDGSSKWITGAEARAEVQRMRAESDAVVVGAGTVRSDDPALTARHPGADRQPIRVVLGRVPVGARARPAVELSGEPGDVLDELGRRDVLQVLIEGGARVAHDFHAGGLIDRYVVFVAPAILGGDDGVPMFSGAGAATLADAWRGEIQSVERFGDDVRIELTGSGPGSGGTGTG
ncbi:MAG: bifunctional diaminohydroxyphosphoribosylaminopyrimidine deaminase/5-amino-6-(5-phosphoribosylamino)uracil reductase RibD [Actinomycetota bacterium]|nr:bifunctional diaminohydroxyphosphoribosylaminopyrimidine deaminase/5-amino-6-(5-phosphoribosylamino)uracil reductase RibD [Actinomycetota bacterium]